MANGGLTVTHYAPNYPSNIMWEEDIAPSEKNASSLDLGFNIQCRCLPLDHAYILSEAIHQQLPWFKQEPLAGLHLLQPPAEGNGWMRPEKGDSLIYLSRRTKLHLRIPKHRLADAKNLSGQCFDVGEQSFTVGKTTEKTLSKTDVLFSHHILADAQQNEAEFIQQMVTELNQHGMRFRKMLAGKTQLFNHPQGQWFTRSLMVADLDHQSAIRLQQQGLGVGRARGFGLFLQHKGIHAVDEE